MRAIRQSEFGGPNVLKLVEVDEPRGLGGDIVVAVKAIGVNPVELAVRSGRYPLYGEPPFTVGSDVSGVVTASNAASRFKPGDEVFGMLLFPRLSSGYAEKVAGPSRHFAMKPEVWSHEQAAAVTLPGLTAWQGLVEAANIVAGDRVLIHGAGGGVGHLAVQIAKARGAYVIATASASKLDFVKGVGADEVVDYGATRFEDAGKVDVVFETIGGDTARRSLAVLQRGGRFVTIVDHRNAERRAEVEALGLRYVGVAVEPDYTHLEAMAELGRRGLLTPRIASRFPLAEASAAHAAQERNPAGKIVLTV